MSQTNTIVAVLALLLLSPPIAQSDVVSEWNEIMVNTLAGQNPLAASRFAAITHTAMFEAVNAITAEYEPYHFAIAASPEASPEAAAVAAAHVVLVNYFPARQTELDTLRANSLATIPDGQAKTDGIGIGEAAAWAIINLRASDGSASPQFYLPSSSNPGEWQPTPGCSPAGGVFLHAPNIMPFGLQSTSQFRGAAPPALTSNLYAKGYNELKRVGAADSLARPLHLSEVAAFYNALFPVPLWGQVARQLAGARPNSITTNARAFALIHIALADAFLAVFDTKYHYRFWRPETAIRNGDVDGNPKTEPNADFVPFITTPCHPSYPSAHASTAYAARRVIHEMWGNGGHFIDLTVPSLPDLTFHYSTLKQITDDIDDARVYGGIHFRFDQHAGAKQGWRVGEYIYGNHLRPSP
jgi:hypothetical protein